MTGGHGIFTQNALIVETGDVIDGQTLTGVAAPSMNDSGEVAFNGVYLAGIGLFTQNALIVAPGDTIDGVTVEGVTSLSLNNLGEVAFRGLVAPAQSCCGILTQNRRVALTGTVIGGELITSLASPSINDDAEVGFTASFMVGKSERSMAVLGSLCGDGIVATTGGCDDGNEVDGDGCSSTCEVELGFVCSGKPSTCTLTPVPGPVPVPVLSARGLLALFVLMALSGLAASRPRQA